jgi:hypothetical protein
MGLKIVIPAGYQRVKKISLTAMPFRGAGGKIDRETTINLRILNKI